MPTLQFVYYEEIRGLWSALRVIKAKIFSGSFIIPAFIIQACQSNRLRAVVSTGTQCRLRNSHGLLLVVNFKCDFADAFRKIERGNGSFIIPEQSAELRENCTLIAIEMYGQSATPVRL